MNHNTVNCFYSSLVYFKKISLHSVRFYYGISNQIGGWLSSPRLSLPAAHNVLCPTVLRTLPPNFRATYILLPPPSPKTFLSSIMTSLWTSQPRPTHSAHKLRSTCDRKCGGHTSNSYSLKGNRTWLLLQSQIHEGLLRPGFMELPSTGMLCSVTP